MSSVEHWFIPEYYLQLANKVFGSVTCVLGSCKDTLGSWVVDTKKTQTFHKSKNPRTTTRSGGFFSHSMLFHVEVSIIHPIVACFLCHREAILASILSSYRPRQEAEEQAAGIIY
jgi:hypothetical protein